MTSGDQLLRDAQARDAGDPLAALREAFHLPRTASGETALYFAGHSLGPQPRAVRQLIDVELQDWASLGVDGHFDGRNPWMPYHELLTPATATLVGALPSEVVVANTLTVNVHLLLASFYRPTRRRSKILIESGAFPSDRYAVTSQIAWHGFDPQHALIEVAPRPGEATLRDEDVLQAIALHGGDLAAILIGNCNYLTGQAFDMPAIVRAGHAVGATVGFDLAHGAGNLDCRLHDSGADFAAWCNYKYLNSGPGGLGGLFVHARHHGADLPRLAGWWGHEKATRFAMGPQFVPIVGAEAWQISNPPILQLAAVRASMALFERAGMAALRQRGDALTAWLLEQLDQLPPGSVELLTPRDPRRRGSMLTVRVPQRAQALVQHLHAGGAVVDLRNPDVVRLTPAPLYTSWTDIARLCLLMHEFFAQSKG